MAGEWWIVEDANGVQQIIGEDPTPVEIEIDDGGEEGPVVESVDRYPEAVLRGALPEWFDTAVKRWDFATGAIVTKASPEDAAAEVWRQAKEYRDVTRRFATVPVVDVVPGETVMVECNQISRDKVADQAVLATWAKSSGTPYAISFTDGSTPNRAFTVDADQVIAIKAAITLNDGACHLASQAVRATIDAALESGATADEILAIDITAGYPTGPVSPPLPPTEPES